MRTPQIRFLGTPAAEESGIWVNPQSELLREPALLRAGEFPVGNVRVDWSHPLAHRLCGCWLFRPNNGLVNLAHDSPFADTATDLRLNVLNGTPTSTPRGYYFNGGVNLAVDPDDVIELGDNNKLSFGIGASFDDITSNVYTLMTIRNGLPNAYILLLHKTDIGGLVAQIDTGGGTAKKSTATKDCVAGQMHNFGISKGVPSAGVYDVYQDGILNGTAAAGSHDTFSADTWSMRIGNYNANLYHNGYIKYLYLWNKRTLTASEWQSIHKDNFQFLIPA